MSRFFIDRPIFAWVIAIIIMLAGAISLKQLPVAQFPPIAPPQISIQASYPGASAKTLEDTVTQVIEQNMKGIDNLDYMASTSDATGQAEITLTFKGGADIDIAQVQVQNKLQLAMPMLPEVVQRQGVVVSKSSASFLLVVAFVSRDDSMDGADISDYLYSSILDQISRVQGVGEASIFGAQYAMRIWCDPDKFFQYGLMPSDVIAAVQAQNAQVPGGQIGGSPAINGQEINLTVIAAKRLETVAEFENIFLRTLPNGAKLLLKDVARIELGGERYFASSKFNGMHASGLAVKLASGANAIETAELVKKRLDELSVFFPAGLDYDFVYDTTPFVKISIKEVYKTLFEAIILVFLVMYLFLQNFRATLIPTIAVPVVLLGTFGILSAFGFSINTLTMFAMVLSIGLLVDDAIVVVENVERLIQTEGLSPKEAAKKSMDQITGALVGIGLVLSAVFVPMAFFGGSTGVIYRQFSVTIVSAMAFSVLVALILTPALCATMLKPHSIHKKQIRFFAWFNDWFVRVALRYEVKVKGIVLKPLRYLIIYGIFILAMGVMFIRLPTSFFPDEDQGMLFVLVQLPPNSSMERTNAVLAKVEDHFLNTEKESVRGLMAVSGFSFAGNGENNGMVFIRLKDWSERTSPEQHVQALQARAFQAFAPIKEAAFIYPFPPPAVIELGAAAGFEFQLLDQGGRGHDELMGAMYNLFGMAASMEEEVGDGTAPASILTSMRPNGMPDVPMVNLDIDLAQAVALGVSIADLNTTIATYWGSYYINDFLDRGRTKKVFLQADAPFRMQRQDFEKYYVRNVQGEMVPLSNFLVPRDTMGSPRLERFNGVPSRQIVGEAVQGRSSGEAMAMMATLAQKLPEGFGFAWSGLSFQEQLSAGQAPALYVLSLLIVFLCLAALYESWSLPFSVMLVVPLGLLGAVSGAMLRGLYNDIYFQVGLLAIIGLSAKNSILIVEFAKEMADSGKGVIESTLEAVRLRLRPIIMTSLAFILGVLPLAISTGAGSGGQNAVGTGVVAGTLSATFLGLFFTPLFFVVISQLFKTYEKKKAQGKKAGEPHE